MEGGWGGRGGRGRRAEAGKRPKKETVAVALFCWHVFGIFQVTWTRESHVRAKTAQTQLRDFSHLHRSLQDVRMSRKANRASNC